MTEGETLAGRARSPLFLVTAAVFLDYASLMVAMPLLPLWGERLGATPLMLGGLFAANAVAQLACAPVLGVLSDRYGRKPLIVLALGLSATSCALIALADSLAMLFAARIVGGVGASIVGAAQAIVADSVHPARRAQAMSYLAAAIGAAHAVGPALGGALAQLGPSVPFWGAAALGCGNMVMTWAVLPNSRRRGNGAHDVSATVAQWRELWRSGPVRRLAAVVLIFGCVIVMLETLLVLFTHHALGWSQAPNAWLRAYHGAVVVAVQLGIVGRCVARFGERRVILGALPVAALGLVLLGFSTTAVTVIIGVGLIGVGAGMISPLLATLLSFVSPPENRGAVLGFAHGLTGVAHLIVPLAASAAFTWSIGSPFMIAGLLCLLAVCLLAAGNNSAFDPGAADERIEAEPGLPEMSKSDIAGRTRDG